MFRNFSSWPLFIFIVATLSVLLRIFFSSVQLLSHVRLFTTPWISACQASLASPTPGVYSNPCSSSRWCHPAISSSVVPFSSCPQSLPASGSSPVSQLFHEGTKVLRPLNIRDLTEICWQEWPADLIATFAWLNKSPKPAVFLRPEDTRHRLLYITTSFTGSSKEKAWVPIFLGRTVILLEPRT